MHIKNLFVFSAVLAMIFLISGCGTKTLMEKGLENQLKKATGQDAQVDLDKGAMKIEGADGATMETGGDVKLPDDFPKDVYVIEGKIIVALKNMYGAGYNLSILSDKSVDEAKKLYEEKLPADGWKLGMSATVGGVVMFSGQKDNRTVSVSLMKDEEKQKTSVVLTLSEPAK